MSNKNSIKKTATEKAKKHLNACGIKASGLGYSAICEKLTGVKMDKASAVREIIFWYKTAFPGWEKDFKDRDKVRREKHLRYVSSSKSPRKKTISNGRNFIKEVVEAKKNIPGYSHPLLGQKEYGDFYKSDQWRQVRYFVLRNTGGRCQCCGAKASDGVSLHVDHIKPRSRYPELELSPDNLQVLCDDCNIGKGDWDFTNWREHFKSI